jgi:hypothetical protein
MYYYYPGFYTNKQWKLNNINYAQDEVRGVMKRARSRTSKETTVALIREFKVRIRLEEKL